MRSHSMSATATTNSDARWRGMLACAATLALATSFGPPSAAADQPGTQHEKPNIVILYADDLGYGDVHCYNPDRGKIPTPWLDRLAGEGMRFTDAHSSSGVCSPSRYTLLTGRYHWRSRLQRGIVGQWEEPLIAADRLTLGTLAKEHGYHTACIGKWHLGWDWPIPPDQRALFAEKKPADAATEEQQRALWATVFTQPIAAGPTTRGFERYFGTDVPNWPPFCFIEGDRTIGVPAVRLKDGPGLEGWTFEPILPTLADRACAFIEEQARQGDPFLLYMPLTSPHTPIVPNAEWQGKSGLNAYADFVMETDAVVGRVMEALDRGGMAGRTLVVFSSDNGCAPAAEIDALERQGHFPSGPLRGHKADAWEGGHRVPFIVRWPGVVEAGTTCDALVHQADLLRTFADILGASLPDSAGEDSVSLLPLLRGDARPVREHAVSASIQGVPAVRSGSWKYIPAPGSGGWSKGDDPAQPVQLYDLANDLGETRNLASAMPDRLAAMQTLLEQLIVAGRSTPGAPQPNDVDVVRYPAAAGAKRAGRKFSANESDSRLRAEGTGWGLEKARIIDPARPRVLLIGDSILGGYQKHVIAALEGRAYVDVWQNPYCQSDKTNRVLAEVLDEGPYDVVHANMGLHGWPVGRIEEGTFEPLTKAYIEVIRAKLPKAKIIWANSTPARTKDAPGELDPVINANILEQNRMSAKVMAEMNVPVNDFYALLENRLDLAKTDQFHWTPPAYQILGEAATRSINQALASPHATSRPPNFIVIFIDDLGYGDIGPFGATKQKTPHLDRMAAEGMKLTSFYAAPVCSVSRAQLLTGCYGARVGVPGVYFPAGSSGLNPAEFTIAERLKPLGYATACIGKWHLGDQPEFLPTHQGFDRSFGIPYSNDMQRVSMATNERVVPLLRDDKVEELLTDDRQRQLVERYTDEAIAFIRDAKDCPFFLYLPHTAVHLPLRPGEKFTGKSGNGPFGDWVEEMDWGVGRMLDTLRELGLDENTLVIFTSDNGPWIGPVGEATSAGRLRGSKGSTWEGGVRVPTIAWWPGRIPPGSACDAVAGTIDLLPTFVRLAGGATPTEPVIDGRDMSPLLLGTTCSAPREAHFYFQAMNLQAVRQGTWKLVIAPQAAGMGKKEAASPESPRLYDLDADIGETTNVAGAHPDIVSRLRLLLRAMSADLATGSRPAGHVANPQMLYPAEVRETKPKRPGKRDSSPPTNAAPE